jgi:hypothetical protein
VAVGPGTTVYIAPSNVQIPDGRMVDPATATFWVSWQSDDEGATANLEDAQIVDATHAVAWGRERSDVVYIRLGHTGDTYFWAGAGDEILEDPSDELTAVWPPAAPPADGWWTVPPESY